MKVVNLIPREYQKAIFETAKTKNTLVVLPTGIGKTAIAILLTENRLNLYPNSKILIVSPTKPLCAQHVKSFNESTDLNQEEVTLYTGAIPPRKRKRLWDEGKVIIATPQTIESDITNNRISLENVCLLVIDEAHRSRMKYANTIVTKNYNENARNKRILALTASPGSTKEKIEEICENLNINAVEIRSLEDHDVKPYVQEKKMEWVNVDLPREFNNIKNLIKQVKDEKITELKRIIPEKKSFNKRDLLDLQFKFRKSILKGNKLSFWGISLTAQLLKLSHALELVETQGIKQLIEYFDKLNKETTKAAKIIASDMRIKEAMQLCLSFKENKHPKMHKLKEIVLDELKQDKNSRIIIFANFRNTVNEIYEELKKNNIIKPVILVGQKEGLTQKEQIKRIKEFGEGIHNVLIGTSISEEGLDIPTANLALFYEPVPSEIRMIQRGGRVGRTTKGKIIFLITKKTRDEAYYWSSKSKERVMKKTLYNIKNKFPFQKKINEYENNSRP